MLRWFDGYEQYGALSHLLEGVGGGAAWSEITSAYWTLATTNPATGSYHLRLAGSASSAGAIARRIFGIAKQVVGFGYRFAISDLPNVEGATNSHFIVLAAFRDVSNAEQCMIVLGTDGAIIAVRGTGFGDANLFNNGTLLGRSNPCVAPGGYHHFEVKAKIDNSVGYIEVRVNEVTVLNLTGIDTQSTANASAAQVAFGQGGAGTGTGMIDLTFDVDDVYAWDDDATDTENTIVDFIGDKGAYYLKPNGDTATADFTKNGSATSFGALDEVPPSGSDYLDTSSTTARTIVQVEALPANVAEVIAFMPVIYTRKEDSGSVTMRGGVVVSPDESYGPDDAPSTAYAYLRPAPKTIDPNTGVAWANTANPDLLIERTA